MGMYAHIEFDISYRIVNDIARKYNLPETRYEYSLAFLTAKDVLEYEKQLTDLVLKMDEGEMFAAYWDFFVLKLVVQHARNYWSDVVCSIPRDLSGKDRKDYCRKKTKEYRMIFA